MEESQRVFSIRIFISWFVPKAQSTQLPAFVDGYRKYWLIWIYLPHIPNVIENRLLENPNFFLGEGESQGKENLNLDLLLVEMQPPRTFWQPKEIYLNCFTVCQLFFEENNHHCNHFLELS